jgi:hydrogenase expression/formation protein HypE
MKIETVKLAHGSGKGLDDLLRDIILPVLFPKGTGTLEDAAVIENQNSKIAFTTDSFVVQPLEFPGGDIGKLAACGTINDLAMMGAEPKYLSISLILEAGLDAGLLSGMPAWYSHTRPSQKSRFCLYCGFGLRRAQRDCEIIIG